MKKIALSLPLWALFVAIVLTGCEAGPIETLTFTSPEGDRTIEVSGVQEAALDPIIVTVKLTAPKITEDFKFEHQASSLTKDNCQAEWHDNQRCTLTFTLDDDEKWIVGVVMEDDHLIATKSLDVDGLRFPH